MDIGLMVKVSDAIAAVDLDAEDYRQAFLPSKMIPKDVKTPDSVVSTAQGNDGPGPGGYLASEHLRSTLTQTKSPEVEGQAGQHPKTPTVPRSALKVGSPLPAGLFTKEQSTGESPVKFNTS